MKKKIIGVYISGRLGNQMFQYAFAKAVKIAQGETGQLVLSFKRVYQEGTIDEGFEDSLRYFNVEPYKTEEGSLVLKYCGICQIMVYLAYVIGIKLFHIDYDKEIWLSCLRKNNLLFSSSFGDKNTIDAKYLHSYKKTKATICSGKYENPIYFDHIKQVLFEEFTPKKAPLETNKGLYEIIEKTNSVCVTVRRGDYLNSEFKDKFYICDEHFFYRAIDMVKRKIENPVLIFFSDDIEWVKNHIKTDLPAYYESGEDPVWEKLRLMYSCKHFIISNSTFSWWAQYLSRNENKVVISPDRWFNDIERNTFTHLLSDSFIKV